MRAPINWINDFTPVEGIKPEIISHETTMTGTKAEGIIYPGNDIKSVVTGKITEINKHPDADKLVVCKVDTGTKLLNIVTGAGNISCNDIVPVALDGAVLPGGMKIKSGKLRGVISEGMLCSINELGFTSEDFPEADPEGIFILDNKLKPGTNIVEVLGLDKPVIDFEITSNRPDCLSVEGIAREVALTMNLDFCEMKSDVKGNKNVSACDCLEVEIHEPDLCRRYVARVIKNVKIQKSPDWIIARLRQAGLRPINNIVDITNYVMIELGQPMHAFDYMLLEDNKIVVRKAKNDEIIVTLDDKKHALKSDMLVISDSDRPTALAGIMGGKNSHITENTSTIVFESANFQGTNVRLTAKNLGIRTESSSRFEKGLDPENAKRAMDRACELVELLGCGDVSHDEIDVYPNKLKGAMIEFSPEKINKFLGTDIVPEKMMNILEKIGCVKTEIEGEIFYQAPGFRPDLEQWVDLSEEIARFYGYNNIKPTLLSGKSTTLGGLNNTQKQKSDISSFLRSRGYFEACTYSFIGKKSFDKILLPEKDELRNAVIISNPLGEDFSMMRTTMLPSLIDMTSLNKSRGVGNIKLFEIAKVYIPQKDCINALPSENEVIAGVHSYEDKSMKSTKPFFEVKGELNELFRLIGIHEKIDYRECVSNPSFHPGRTADIYHGDDNIGILGYIHPDIAENAQISPDTIIFMLEYEKIRKIDSSERKFSQLPKYPSIARDIAIIVDKDIKAGDIDKVIRKNSGELLESVKLFDVYTGKQLDETKKSLAYNLVFRSSQGTLTDNEISPVTEKILNELKKEFKASLR